MIIRARSSLASFLVLFNASRRRSLPAFGGLAVLLAGVLLGGSGRAAQIVWTNTAGGNWNLASNWNPNQVPRSTDDAFITNNGTYTVTLDASATVATFTLGGTSGTQSFAANANSLTLNGASTVGTNGSFNLGGGTLSGAGSLTVNGPFTWSSGTINNTGGVTLNGASSLSGIGTAAMTLSGLLINAGTLTWNGSGQNLYIYYSGALSNLAAGTIIISADVSSYGGGGTIGNAGLLRKTGTTGATTLNASFVNSGDVQVQSGTLNLAGGGSASGTFEVSANAWLIPNAYTLSSPSSLTGAGTVLVSGTLNLNGANTIGASTTLSLGGGTLSGAGSLTVNGPFDWSSGSINNTGGVTLNGASSLNGVGSAAMSLSGLLINTGTLTWSGSGQNLYINGGALTNLAAGTIIISADVSSYGGGGTIGNAGLLSKVGTTGTTTLNATFVNSGDVQVQSGTLNLAGGGSASGTFEVSANAWLNPNNYTLSSSSSITGAGTISVSGTLNLNGANTIGANTTLSLGGGTLNGTGSLAVNGPFTWSSGSINITGGVTLNGASSLNGAGFNTLSLNGLLINAGTLTWGGSGQNLYFSGGTLTNLASGTITISADVSSAGGGTIGNAGLLRKTGTTGATTVNSTFVNSGDVQAQSGTLALNGGGSASGTFEESANATLQFANNYTLGSASSVTGAGTANFSAGTVNLSGTLSMTGTNIINGGTLAVNAPGSMAVTNLIILSGGSLNGNAPVAVNGPFTWSNGSIYNTGGVRLNGASSLNGAGNNTMYLYGLLINAGTLTWGGSGQNLYFSGGALTNLASGTITISADVSSAGAGTIGNAGLLSKVGTTGTTTLNSTFVNSGDVQVQSGTLALNGGGSASGTFEVSANAWLVPNNYTLSFPSSITGAGTVSVSSGTLNLNGANTIGAGTIFNLSGGTLSGAGSLTVNGSFTWSSGTIQNAGGVTLNGASSLNGAGFNTLSLNGLLINAGTLTWGGSGGNLYISGGVLTNLASGTITINADVSSPGGGTIGNAGLLRKTGTTGITTLNATFVNSGDVQVQSGTLNLAGGGSAGGTFEVSANATLQFANNYTLGAASSVTGAGTAIFSVGTVNLSGTLSMTGTNIINGGTLAVNAPGSMAVANLIILSSGSLNGNAPVAVNGPFTWSNGTINNTGGVRLNGASSLNGAGFNTLSLNGLLINAGTLTWGGSGQNLYLSGGVLTNLASGTITISADVSVGGGGAIGNAGVLSKIGTTGATTLNVTFVNSGDVQAQSGTLDLNGGGSASGTFEVSADATLQFANKNYTLGAASSVTGAGTAIFSGGTVNLSGTLSMSGTNIINGGTLAVNAPGSMAVTNLIILSGGSLNGNAPVAVNGPFTWSNGSIYNTGGVTLNGASSLNGAGNSTMQLYGLLINAGALTWSGSDQNLYISGGALTNLASGSITISADVSVGGGGTIGNAGLLSKTGGAGTTALNVAFVNSGTAQANSGTLSFGGIFLQNAGQTVLNGGNFAFSQVAQLLGGTLAGAGAITGSVSNNAAIGTGPSPGLLTISGNYAEGPHAHLAIKLGGTTAGASYDQLSIGGSAALAGSLNISYWNGFTPTPGAVFTVLACNARGGVFSALTAPTNVIAAIYTANAVLVEVGHAAPVAQLTVPAHSLAGHTFVVKGSGTALDGTVTNLALLLGTNVLVSAPGNSAQVNFSSDFPGNLTFTALATDNQGAQGSTNATVDITTLPLMTLDAVGFQTNGAFKLLMLGQTGTNYQVLTSTNVAATSWTALGTMESTNGIWRFSDTTATNFPQRFYQVWQLP